MTDRKRIASLFGFFAVAVILFLFPACHSGETGTPPISPPGGGGTGTPPISSPVGELFVCNNSNDTVVVFDASANGNVNPLRRFSSKGLSSPSGIAVDNFNNEIFAPNDNNSVIVYSRTADGGAVPIRTVYGGSTGLESPQGIAVDTVNDEIFVANSSSVTVYERGADGDSAPRRTINTGATAIAVDPVNNEILVTNSVFNPDTSSYDYAITVYARTAQGNASPLRTITGLSTGLHNPHGIAVDTVNNEIFVANTSYDPVTDVPTGKITVYARTAQGNISPLRTISGTSTSLAEVTGVAVDNVHDEVLAVSFNSFNDDSVVVFARTVNGNAQPLRRIFGDATWVSDPRGVAVDMVNNEITVANSGGTSITVYERTADGNATPVRRIVPGFVDLTSPVGVAVDDTEKEVFVVGRGNAVNGITVYRAAANGSVHPVRTISGDSVPLIGPQGIVFDPVNKEILVTNSFSAPRLGDISSVTVYPSDANGNIAPVRTIAGGSTGLFDLGGLAVDAVNNEIIVANGNDTVTVYRRTARNNEAPLRNIAGISTFLGRPRGIAVDTLHNEIFVANFGLNSITVYERTAAGDAAPLRIIAGGSTGLYGPAGVLVDPANDEIYVTNVGFDPHIGNLTNSITVYPRTADGDIQPLRAIFGGATGLDAPVGIAGGAQ